MCKQKGIFVVVAALFPVTSSVTLHEKLQRKLTQITFFFLVLDPDLFLKSARLQRLPSSASDLASNDLASLHETTKDPFTEGCACQRDGLTVIITACLTFATGVTVALIMQIYLGDPQVGLYLSCLLPELQFCSRNPGNYERRNNTVVLISLTHWLILLKVFNQGAVVTDAAQCTSLGFEVLAKQGSSVDAAIAAALCLGIVHPHTSGIGGWDDQMGHSGRFLCSVGYIHKVKAFSVYCFSVAA